MIEQILRRWYGRRQTRAMTAQFRTRVSEAEAAERRDWKTIRIASARDRSVDDSSVHQPLEEPLP